MAAGAILVEAAARRLEICEHKGAGHRDTLTDGACEAAAAALAGAYGQALGAPMHFNVDKGLLAAALRESVQKAVAQHLEGLSTS